MKKTGYFLIILFFALSIDLVGQNLTKARHETDNQRSVDVEFNVIPGTSPTPVAFKVTANGISMNIISVSPIIAPSYRITFSAPLPVDPDPVVVTYLPNGSDVVSENNRPVLCADFEWVTNTRPTPSCAPVDPINKMVFRITPGARNSSNYDLSKIESRISWNDPQSTVSSIQAYESEESGSRATKANYVTFDADLDNFTYPTDDDGCSYMSEWAVFINGIGGCLTTNPNQFITYTSHNVDDKGNGQLKINPSVSKADKVCLNDEANVQFKDVSILNCIGGTTPNNEGRWVRIFYGDPSRAAGARIPNIRINGIPVTDEHGNLLNPNGAGNLTLTADGIIYTGGGADIFGVKYFPSPITGPVGGFLPITTQSTTTGFANRQPGDKFSVRMEYWNICNPYDNVGNVTNNERAVSRAIEIIDIPEPPVPAPREICFKEAAGNFTLKEALNSTEIRWYDAHPNEGGKIITNPLGKNSLQLPAASIVNNAVSGVYSVWATSISGANSCESEAVETTIVVKNLLSKPGDISGTRELCNGSTNVVFTVPEAEGSSAYGGQWEYFWKHSGGGGVTFDNNTGKSVSVDLNISTIAGDSTTRTIQVVKRYKSSSNACTGTSSTYQVTIYNSSLGGTMSSDKTICEGGSTGNLTISGHRGKVLAWQRKANDGYFTDITGTEGLITFSEILNAAGTYTYRAMVANGSCDPAFSSPTVIKVNPVPDKPVITEASGKSMAICAGSGDVVLKSSNPGALGQKFVWYKTSDLVNPVQSGSDDELILTNVTQSGEYVVQLIGESPTSCEGPLSDAVTVSISPLPSATASGGGSVCAGNPAPDIVWELQGVAPFSFRIKATDQPDIIVNNYTSNTYTIAAPKPETTTTYQMTSLTDANGCASGSLGKVLTVEIGGTPPVLENATPTVGPAVCNNSSTTVVPSITFDLDLQDNYTLIYSVNGGANQSVTFKTDVAGVYTLQPDYLAAPFNSTPGTYTYNFISISNSSTGCLTPLNQSVNVVINPRPVKPVNPRDAIVCSNSETGGGLSVDDPGAGYKIRWFSSYSGPEQNTPVSSNDGVISGTRNNIFTPSSSAAAMYYAAVQNNSTGCLSTKAVAVNLIQDKAPIANADTDNDMVNNVTCSEQFSLNANSPNGNEQGTWTGPAGVIFSNMNDPAATVSNLPIGNSTLRWTVKSALGVCAESFDEVTIERYGVPEAIDPMPYLCAGGSNLEVSGINLSDYRDKVTGITGSANLNIGWYSNPERTVAVANPDRYTATNSAVVYTRITNTLTGCFSDGTLTFIILKKPEARDIVEELCEDVLNSNEVANIDLTGYNNEITGSAPVSERTVKWYSDAEYSVEIPDPANVAVNHGEIFYARVTDISNEALCSNDAEIIFTVNPLPEDNQIIGPTIQCMGSTIQLYQINPSLNPGSTYIWDVPEEFVLFGGGGKDNFFILLNFPVATTADLRVTEVSADGCTGNVQTLSINVVDSPPLLEIIPKDPQLCENEAGVTFSVENLPNTTYYWSVPGGASIINGQGTNEIVVNFSQYGGNVSVVPSSSTGNCSGNSAITSVTINESPQLATELGNTVCSGQRTGINLSYMPGGQPATGYDITNISLDPGLINGDNNAETGDNQPSDAISNDVFINQTGRQLSVNYTIRPRSNNECPGKASIVTLYVNPVPKLSASLNKEICSGEPSDIVLAVAPGSISAASYNIISIDDGGLLPDSSNNTFAAEFPYNNVNANFLQSEIFRNYTDNPIDLVLEVVPVNQECIGEPSQIVLTVNPEPVGPDFTEETKCSGETINLTLQDYINNNVESNFSWTATYGADIKDGLNAGSGDISERLTNSGNKVQEAIYTITPRATASSCAGEAFTITIPVNAEIKAIDQNLSICESETVVDLTIIENQITAGIANPLTWFKDAAITDEITTPEAYDIKGQNAVYARVMVNGCTKVAKVNFSKTRIEISTIGVTSDYNGYDISCVGAADASVKFQAVGGIAPYRYALNEIPANTTGITTGEFSGLPSGTYTVTVTDASSCSGAGAEPAIVTEPIPLNAGTVFGPPNICTGSIPSTFVQISPPIGGTGNYTYQWEVSRDSIIFSAAKGATANKPEYNAVEEDFSTGEGKYYFRRVVSSGATESCINVQSNVIEVTVNPLPTGDFTFKDTNGNDIEEICAGEPFLIEFNLGSGKSGYTFEYHDDKGNAYTDSYGSSTTPVLVNFDEVTSTTTFTLDRVTDMYGCKLAKPLDISHTIYVMELDANFSVEGPNESCSPATIEFSYNQKSGVTYTWRWFDGTPDSTYTATSTVADKRITHKFNNESPTAIINYEVFLFASDNNSSGSVCEQFTSEKITVHPKVKANIFAQNPEVCSGDDIRFMNLTPGSVNHRWFYRQLGNDGQEEQIQTIENATFSIDNSGPNNPQIYEVVYTASSMQSGGNVCADTQIVQVEVYKKAIPDFTYSPDPPIYENGSASLLFTNTSIPSDESETFSYNWNFGDDILKEDSANPGVVNYTKPGQKIVTLDVVNKASPGLCDVSVKKAIHIGVLPITADFKVDKTSVCKGSDILITNESVGEANEFTWEILDENNNTVHKHSDLISSDEATKINPSFAFKPSRAGVYNVQLTATNIYSNDSDQIIRNEVFKVYETPVANFDTQPDLIFIPDQPLITFNLSNNADEFSWNFGDGSDVSTSYEPEHYYEGEGNYDVTLIASTTYPGGLTCSDTLTRKVTAQAGGGLKLPNAFSPSPYGPSGDGKVQNEEANDIFLPVTEGVVEFQMVIYDRWGKMIFKSTDSTIGWDGYDKNGKLLPAGVYIYQLTLRFSNGQRRQITGDVMLIR